MSTVLNENNDHEMFICYNKKKENEGFFFSYNNKNPFINSINILTFCFIKEYDFGIFGNVPV